MNRQDQINAFTLAAHRVAVERLREQPELIDQAVSLLRRWREQAGPTRSDRYWDEWERLLAGGVDRIEQATCGADEHAATLRSTSPLGVLISQCERSELLREARQAA